MPHSLTRRSFVALPMAVGGLFLGSCAGLGINTSDAWIVSKIDIKRTNDNDTPQLITIEYDDRGRVTTISPRTIHNLTYRGGTGSLESEGYTTQERAFSWDDDEHVTEEVITTKRVTRGYMSGETWESTDTFKFALDPTLGTVTLNSAIVGGSELESYNPYTDVNVKTYEVEYEANRISSIKTGYRGCTFYKGIPLTLWERDDEEQLPPSKWSVIDESQREHIDIKHSSVHMPVVSETEISYDDTFIRYTFDDNNNLVKKSSLGGETGFEFGYVHIQSPAKCTAFCSHLIMAAVNTGITIISDGMINEWANRDFDHL